MKILLVRPPAPNKLSFMGILDAEPLELEYLHTGLKQAGYEDRIYDYLCEKIPFEKVLKAYCPDAVAISGYITQEKVIKKLCKKVKFFDDKIATIVGGVHAQLNYERFYEDGIDFILRSESIDAFVELIHHLSIKKNNGNKEGPEKIALYSINGLCFRDAGSWMVNPVHRVDINTLPIPDRSFFQQHCQKFRYLDLTEVASLKTSFSCPYSCNFCYCTLLHQGRYQTRDLQLVMEELKTIPATNIQIVDDDFLVDEQRVWEFIRLIRANDIHKTYICYARADFVCSHSELVKALVEIGFRYFLVGLEAICDEELFHYNKGTKTRQNAKAVEVIQRAGGECIALMIMGLDAQKKDFDHLYQWVVRHELLHVTVSIFTPIPGTPLYEEYKDRLITDNIEHWDFLHLVVEPEKISRKQFYRYYRRLFLRLYRRAKKSGQYDFMDLPYYKKMLSNYLLRRIYLDF